MTPRLTALIGALALAGCGAPAEDRPELSAADMEAFDRANAACVEADSRANAHWREALDQQTDVFAFQESLQAFISACSPVVDMLASDYVRPEMANVVEPCRQGYTLKIAAYQAILDGAARDVAADQLVRGSELIRSCDLMTTTGSN